MVSDIRGNNRGYRGIGFGVSKHIPQTQYPEPKKKKMKHIKHILSVIIASILFCTFSLHAQDGDARTQQQVEFFFLQALMEKEQGNFAEAFDLLQFCYALDPTHPEVLIELSLFFRAMGNRAQAIDLIRRVVKQDPTHFDASMILAELSIREGRHQEAIDIHYRLLQLYPDRIELLFDLANVFADSGQWQRAIDALNQLESIVGISDQLSLNKMQFYLMLEDGESARNEVRQLLNDDPLEPRFYILMGDLYYQDDRIDDALRYYQMALLVAPDFLPAIFSIINFYERTEQPDAAQAALMQALTLETLDFEFKLQLLEQHILYLYEMDQDLVLIDPMFQTLQEMYPYQSELNLLIATVMMVQGREEEAMENFQIYIRNNPDDPFGYEQILNFAVENEDFEKIIAVATQAIEHLPQYPQFYFFLGMVYFQQGEYAEAHRVFMDALQHAEFRHPALKSIFLGQVGDLYYHLDDKESAFVFYGKALEQNPNNLHVLNNYAYFLALERRDLDRAERMSAITIRAEPQNPTFLDTYGWVLFQQGAYALARVYLERAMQFSADDPNPVIKEQYGDVLYRTGDAERAMQMWLQARELGADSEALNRKIETGTLERMENRE